MSSDHISSADTETITYSVEGFSTKLHLLDRHAELIKFQKFILHLRSRQSAGGLIFLTGPPEHFVEFFLKRLASEPAATLFDEAIEVKDIPDWVAAPGLLDREQFPSKNILIESLNDQTEKGIGSFARKRHKKLADAYTDALAVTNSDEHQIADHQIFFLPIVLNNRRNIWGETPPQKVIKEFNEFLVDASKVQPSEGRLIQFVFCVHVLDGGASEISVRYDEKMFLSCFEFKSYEIIAPEIGDFDFEWKESYFGNSDWREVEHSDISPFINSLKTYCGTSEDQQRFDTLRDHLISFLAKNENSAINLSKLRDHAVSKIEESGQ